MPIYHFRCKKCGYDEDILLPMEQRNEPRHHTCGEVMARIISTPRFKMVKSDSEAAYEAMNDDNLSRNPAVRDAMTKKLHYNRSVF